MTDPTEHGGMPDLFEMAGEGDPDAVPIMGAYVEHGHSVVVRSVVCGDGIAQLTNEQGERESRAIMLLGLETIDGTRHMFTFLREEVMFMVEGGIRALENMLIDENPDRTDSDN